LDFQDKDGNTYLHLAVIAQQEDIIKSLIEKGIFINKQNKDGNTGLHLAYIFNDISIIKLLLESGIDKNIVNKDNKLAEEMKIKPKKYNQSVNNEIRSSGSISRIEFSESIGEDKYREFSGNNIEDDDEDDKNEQIDY